jgi:hypothetical protein
VTKHAVSVIAGWSRGVHGSLHAMLSEPRRLQVVLPAEQGDRPLQSQRGRSGGDSEAEGPPVRRQTAGDLERAERGERCGGRGARVCISDAFSPATPVGANGRPAGQDLPVGKPVFGYDRARACAYRFLANDQGDELPSTRVATGLLLPPEESSWQSGFGT